MATNYSGPIRDRRSAVPLSSRARAGASIRDVARRAGVSPATASRSLRGNPAVTSATRERVLAAARELAYVVPHPPEPVPLVAVLARFPSRWYYAQAITEIEAALGDADRRLVLHNVGSPTDRRRFFERIVPTCSYDAVIVVSASFDSEERTILDGLGIPITVVGGYLPGYPTVSIDEVAAARTAVEHLIGLGHRRIGLISFEPDGEVVGRETLEGRRRGFEQALLDSGLRVVPEWIVEAQGSRTAGGVRAAELLLTRPQLPTAIFAMSDELAIGALRAIRRAGLSVPGNISVVGFDDHELAEFVDLTTVHQPVGRQARAAAALLDSDGGADLSRTGPGVAAGNIGASSAPAGDTGAGRTELAVRLVVRGTTGPPA